MIPFDLSILHNIHHGESAILFGSGPTFSKYDDSMFDYTNVLKVGTNEMVYTDIDLDYYFLGDAGTEKRGYLSAPTIYRDYTATLGKFIKIKSHRGGHHAVPIDIPNANYYNVNRMTYTDKGSSILNYDLSTGTNDAGSISFDALQVLLYAGVSTIYLVGHDCTYSGGTFIDSSVDVATRRWGNTILENWTYVKQFCAEYYPNVKIYSVNPVALGIFEGITMGQMYDKIVW